MPPCHSHSLSPSAIDGNSRGAGHSCGGTDLSPCSQADLEAIAGKLNTRPRKTLDYRSPAEALNDLLVATTA
jgi:hypothetical protein